VQVSNKAGELPYSLYAYDSYGVEIGGEGDPTLSSYKGYDKGPFGYKTGVRQYDPETGRFLSPDPFKGYMTDPASQHPYMYCRGNPIRYSDPSGFFTWPPRYGGRKIYIEWGDTIKDINKQLPGAGFKGKVSWRQIYDVSYIFPKGIVNYLGKENPGTSCADFVYAYKENLNKIPNKFKTPNDFLKKYVLASGYTKTNSPSFGDIVVFYKNKDVVHVGIYLSTDRKNKKWTLGQMGVGKRIEAQPESITSSSPAIKATKIEYYTR